MIAWKFTGLKALEASLTGDPCTTGSHSKLHKPKNTRHKGSEKEYHQHDFPHKSRLAPMLYLLIVLVKAVYNLIYDHKCRRQCSKSGLPRPVIATATAGNKKTWCDRARTQKPKLMTKALVSLMSFGYFKPNINAKGDEADGYIHPLTNARKWLRNLN